MISMPQLAGEQRATRLGDGARLAAVAGASTLVTAAVFLFPSLRGGFAIAPAHVVVETVAAVVALSATFLLWGRYLRTGRLDELLLAQGFGVLACANVVFAVVAVANVGDVVLSAWAPTAVQLVGVLLVAVAGIAPSRALRRVRGAILHVNAGFAVVLVGILLLLTTVLPHLPDIRPSRPLPAGLTPIIAAQLVLVAGHAVAAVGFSRKAAREGDVLTRWLALSAVLSTFGRLNYAFYPTMSSQWISAGDMFRLLASFALLWGAGQEITGYWRRLSAGAVLEERRRMARDLHDGLAQELAYIARRARRGGDAQEALRQISASADRALLESRRAIAALSLPMDERFDVVLARIAEETAARAGARIDLRLDAGLVIEREHAEGLIRIVSEAVGNATRHGHADSLVIELDDGPQRRLRVSDNGTGFESAQVAGRRAPGFGLVSMQERAAALGGTLHVESAPGQGTVVEVRF